MDEKERTIEAMIFASETPLRIKEIAEQLGGLPSDSELTLDTADISAYLAAITKRHVGSGIELVNRGGCWHFQTPSDLAGILRRDREEPRKLSQAARETLAIIAYHEPVTRADIEEIRGVQPGRGTLAVLMQTGWIAPAGRRAVPGRPLMYKTTALFLSHFGLTNRKDLPGIEDLRAAGLLDPIEPPENICHSPADSSSIIAYDRDLENENSSHGRQDTIKTSQSPLI